MITVHAKVMKDLLNLENHFVGDQLVSIIFYDGFFRFVQNYLYTYFFLKKDQQSHL